MVTEMGQALCQTLRLGGGEHRRDIQLLSLAPAAPQKPEIDQHARAFDGRDQAAHARGPNLPNPAACLRLVRALAVERHENWIEAMQYLKMDPLHEQKKEALRRL